MPNPYVFNPARGTGDFIVREANGYRSREEVVINSGAGVLPVGTVLEKSGAGYVARTTGTAAGILFEEVDATDGAVKRTIICRDCEVQRAMLNFAGTPDQATKDAAYAQLAALGIAFR